MKISSCVITYNEEKNIPQLIESLKGCDEIIIADGGSTDNTFELAKELGANVYKREDVLDVSTVDDVKKFEQLYGYKPKFQSGDLFRDASEIRNDVVKKAKNDWIFFPDADEFVTWNLDDIYRVMPQCDLVECKLVQSRDEKGEPISCNNICKLYNKNTARWVERIHEVVLGNKREHVESMKLDHYKKPNSQSRVYEYLEWSVLKDGDARSMFYLMREYYYYKEWKKSLDMFDKYLQKAVWRPEIAYAFYIRAKCAWQLHMGDQARAWCINAIAINPDFKAALYDMSVYTGEGQSIYWKKYSDIATSNDVLFIN